VRMSLTAAKSDFLSVRPEQERKILRLLTPLAKLGVPRWAVGARHSAKKPLPKMMMW
jgi:hypothetical protein